MTPDIEQVRAELVRTMASTIGSMVGAATASATARIAFDAADNILEALNYAALLAAIDELTARAIAAEKRNPTPPEMLAAFDEVEAQVDQLTAQRDAVLALHKQIPAPNLEEYECCECLAPWPCETVRALTKAVQ